MKNMKQLIESLNRHSKKLSSTNEVAFGAALKGAGSKVAGAMKSAASNAKAIGKNTLNGAKITGQAIKNHPVRTAAVVGGAAAGYGAYKGAKKLAGQGKKAYNNWNM